MLWLDEYFQLEVFSCIVLHFSTPFHAYTVHRQIHRTFPKEKHAFISTACKYREYFLKLLYPSNVLIFMNYVFPKLFWSCSQLHNALSKFYLASKTLTPWLPRKRINLQIFFSLHSFFKLSLKVVLSISKNLIYFMNINLV